MKRGKHQEAKPIQMCDVRTKEILKTFDSISSACDYLGKYPTGQANISAVAKGKVRKRKRCKKVLTNKHKSIIINIKIKIKERESEEYVR